MNGAAVWSVSGKAGTSVGRRCNWVLVMLVLLLSGLAMTPVRAEGRSALGVTSGDFVARFNEMVAERGYDVQIDASYVHDTEGDTVQLSGPLGNFATLIATISKENKEMVAVIVMLNTKGQGDKALKEGGTMAYAAMTAAAPGTSFDTLVTGLDEELQKGNSQARFGKVVVKAESMGKLGIMYSASPQNIRPVGEPLALSAKDYFSRFNAAMKASGKSYRLETKGIKKSERSDSLIAKLNEDVVFLGMISKDKTPMMLNLVFIAESYSSPTDMNETYLIISKAFAVLTPGLDSSKLDERLRNMQDGEKITVGDVVFSRSEDQRGLIFTAQPVKS